MDENSFRELNGGDDEDEALRQALAMSMQQADSSHDSPGSKAASSTKDQPETNVAKETAPASAPASSEPPAAVSSFSLLGLDRRAMEAERLARRQRQLAKQQGPQTSPQKSPQKSPPKESQKEKEDQESAPRKVLWKRPSPQPQAPPKRKAEANVIVIDDDDDESTASDASEAPLPQKRKLDNGAAAVPYRSRPSGSDSTSTSTSTSAILPFPRGVVKKTSVRGQPRRGDDITIEEVWQKDALEMALLSSFQWDEAWMLARLDVRRTRVLLIAYAADDEQKAQMRANVPSAAIRFCFPPMTAMGAMHSKLQLLKYATYLRVVVPTGNLVPYDWGETGTLENMVFIIDLPRLDTSSQAPESARTPFLDDLSYFLTMQEVDESLIRSLQNYDFSETARYAFVHTASGSHLDDAWKRTGLAGLGRAVQTLGWSSSRAIQVDYLCSSVGSLDDSLLNALYYACQGDSGMKEYEARINKPRRGKGKDAVTYTQSTFTKGPRDCTRLYFPSEQTVSQSLGGKNGAGTICFQAKWWDAPTFPRGILRDAQNVRSGVLIHTKLLFVRRSPPPGADGAVHGWAYVGSANMSESAWGRLVKDKGSGKVKMSCRNWECGVLIPASAAVADTKPDEGPGMLDLFRDTVPIPIALPGTKYGKGAEKRPWFFMEG